MKRGMKQGNEARGEAGILIWNALDVTRAAQIRANRVNDESDEETEEETEEEAEDEEEDTKKSPKVKHEEVCWSKSKKQSQGNKEDNDTNGDWKNRRDYRRW